MTGTGNSGFVDYYKLLGISPSADIPQIRNAFIQKAKQHHPDAGGSTEAMQQLNLAYKMLMSTSAKGAYDLVHGFQTGETQPSDYRYQGDRQVSGVTDMSDEEIDSFLDTVFDEYRDGPPRPNKSKQTVKQRVKKLFEL